MTAKVIDAALKEMDVRGRTLVLTLASSGARLNEVLSLKLSDIDLESNPVKITIRGVNAKNKQTRFTFISHEAAQCVRAWLKKRDEYLKIATTRNKGLIGIGKSSEKITDTDLLFPFSDNAANSMWETALRASGQFTLIQQPGATSTGSIRSENFSYHSSAWQVRKFWLNILADISVIWMHHIDK